MTQFLSQNPPKASNYYFLCKFSIKSRKKLTCKSKKAKNKNHFCVPREVIKFGNEHPHKSQFKISMQITFFV